MTLLLLTVINGLVSVAVYNFSACVHLQGCEVFIELWKIHYKLKIKFHLGIALFIHLPMISLYAVVFII